jgi:hypothetical protein
VKDIDKEHQKIQGTIEWNEILQGALLKIVPENPLAPWC